MSDEQAETPDEESPADEAADEPADASETESEQSEPAESEADDAETEDEGFQPGDFVQLEYTIETVPDEDDDVDEGRVVDTTREEVAEEAGIDDDEYEFSPETIQIGEGHVFESVDADLQGKSVGASNTVTVEPTEAFGEYDPEEVRTVSKDKIPEDDRYAGAQVTVDGDQGYVERIIGGRARVDFNHPLAGETLAYEYEVVGEVTSQEEQAQAVLGMYLQETPSVRIETETVEREYPTERIEDDETGEVHEETTTEEVEERSLYIEATPMMQMNQQWMFSKQQIASQLMEQLDLDRVVIEEVIDGSGMGGMGGMMGGMGGMGAMGGGEDDDEIDVDADELVEELEEDAE